MTTTTISPLRQRMIEDMTARKLSPATQQAHIRSWRRFAAFLQRSPESACSEDIRRFQLHLSESAISIPSRDGAAILALADLLVGLDLSGRLAEITCPVLVIQPDAGPFIPLDVPLALKQGLPDADLMVIPGTRHGIAYSHGKECASAVLDFLERRQLV